MILHCSSNEINNTSGFNETNNTLGFINYNDCFKLLVGTVVIGSTIFACCKNIINYGSKKNKELKQKELKQEENNSNINNEEIQEKNLESSKIIETYGKDVTIDGLYSAINEFLLSFNGVKISFDLECYPPKFSSIYFQNDELKASFKKLYIIGILYPYYNSNLNTFKTISSNDCEEIKNIIDWNITEDDTLRTKSNELVSTLLILISYTIVNKNCGRPCVNLNDTDLQDLVKILFPNSDLSEFSWLQKLKGYVLPHSRPESLKFATNLINALNNMKIIKDENTRAKIIKFSDNK